MGDFYQKWVISILRIGKSNTGRLL
ncbi:uncharacterized protein METZ01_LOCUS27800 [marine metagenome]|uniref:Uncharacterized protein n=1 Tax=marine metagenome TaxID=408172 RepID=A0A381Q6H2_9ZZZZ